MKTTVPRSPGAAIATGITRIGRQRRDQRTGHGPWCDAVAVCRHRQEQQTRDKAGPGEEDDEAAAAEVARAEEEARQHGDHHHGTHHPAQKAERQGRRHPSREPPDGWQLQPESQGPRELLEVPGLPPERLNGKHREGDEEEQPACDHGAHRRDGGFAGAPVPCHAQPDDEPRHGHQFQPDEGEVLTHLAVLEATGSDRRGDEARGGGSPAPPR